MDADPGRGAVGDLRPRRDDPAGRRRACAGLGDWHLRRRVRYSDGDAVAAAAEAPAGGVGLPSLGGAQAAKQPRAAALKCWIVSPPAPNDARRPVFASAARSPLGDWPSRRRLSSPAPRTSQRVLDSLAPA